MKKSLLLGLAVLLAVCSVSAQVLQMPTRKLAKKSSKARSEQTVRGMKPFKALTASKMWIKSADIQSLKIASSSTNNVRKTPFKAGVASTTMWYSYPNASQCYVVGFDQLAEYYPNYFGVCKGQTVYNVYSEIPYNYEKAVVDSVDIIFYDVDKIKDSVYIYFMGLEDSTGVTYKEYPVSASELKGLSADGKLQYTSIALPETYTVPEGGCKVGYAFEAEEGANPIVSLDTYDTYGTIEGSYYFTFLDGEERYYADFNSFGFGSLTTAVHMDLSNCPSCNVSIESLGEQTTLAGEDTEIGAYVDNDGPSGIANISYILSVDGVAQPEATYTFTDGLESGAYEYVAFATQSFEEGTHEVSVTITKVDGQDNTSTSKVADDGYYIALEKGADRKSVVEEITSTSCGYCPRGAVALAKLKEKGVITLANHWGYSWVDPMTVEDNYDFVSMAENSVGGFPGALFDRCVAGDPYFGLTDGSYGFVADQYCDMIKKYYPSEASLTLTADWADDAKTQIKVSTDYTFGYDRMDGAYAIAYILSEDGMVGNDSTWMQLNYYSGDTRWSQFDGMASWVNADEFATTSYDDVVVAVWGSYEGLDDSVEPIITKGVTETHNKTLSISGNSLIQDKSKLKITALLLNRNNGCIVNAAQVDLNVGGSGINGVSSDGDISVKEVARYNANGQRIAAPQKGLNIIKMSNGKSVKVMVNK